MHDARGQRHGGVTNTEQIQELRKGITELVVSEHPHGCLTCHRIELCGPQDICLRHVSVTDRCVACPKNDRCELKDTTLCVMLTSTYESPPQLQLPQPAR